MLHVARTRGVGGRGWSFDGRLELACLVFAFLRTAPWCVAPPLCDHLIVDPTAKPGEAMGALLGTVVLAAAATLFYVSEHDHVAYGAHLRNFARHPPQAGAVYMAPAEYRAAVCDIFAGTTVAMMMMPQLVLLSVATLAAFVLGSRLSTPAQTDALHAQHGVVAAHMVLLVCGGFWLLPPGAFTPGRLIACVGLLHTAFSNVTRLALHKDAWRHPPGSATPRVRELVQDCGYVCLRDVQVQWPGLSHPTLHRLGLEMPPNSRVALVGASGSGKTTLARLLCGEIEAEQGDGTVDGCDLRRVQAGGYVAYVGHTPWLTTGSVADNLTVAPADDDDLHDVLVNVGFEDDELPDGTQTQLIHYAFSTSRSVALRINIARALLCRPRLLILDQTLDALDPAVSQRVMQGLARMSCTVLVLTLHASVARLATRRGALLRGQVVWER